MKNEDRGGGHDEDDESASTSSFGSFFLPDDGNNDDRPIFSQKPHLQEEHLSPVLHNPTMHAGHQTQGPKIVQVADAMADRRRNLVVEQSDPSTTHNTPSGAAEKEGSSSRSDDLLAVKETRAVCRSKLLVYVALLLAAGAVGTAVYLILSRQEQQEFEEKFKMFANDLLDIAGRKMQSKFDAMITLSIYASTVSELSQATTWPNVTLANFELLASAQRHESDTEVIAFAPLVRRHQMHGWQAYASEMSARPIELQELDGSLRLQPNASASNVNTRSASFNPTGDVFGSWREDDVVMPLWQISPALIDRTPHEVYDLFQLDWFVRLTAAVSDHGNAHLSGIQNMDFLFQFATSNASLFETTSDRHPRSLILQPVYNSLNGSDTDMVAAVLMGIIRWRDYFTNIIPDGINGLIVEIADTCGSSFTYLIDGTMASLDVQYQASRSFESLRQTRHYGEFDLDANDEKIDGTCQYSITVFPSDMFRTQYTSNVPFLYAFAVVMIFKLTAMVFLTYDIMVERRQFKVMRTAERTTAIVSSIFPKDVQKRLFEEAEAQARNEGASKKGKFGLAPRSQMHDFLSNGAGDQGSAANAQSRPIADFFPCVTIMFADITGFTAWSSTREPTQVFTLLETIFQEFDEMTKRRRVFKVETVGDCYVAVAGLPEKRKDHHTVMARFARDCLYKMNLLTKELEVLLGPDTVDLGMRFGLHSWPVTAGVLRGDRARFQMFGDTVNTTARIESTGEKNRIHISKETADLLIKSGKGHWVVPRETKVMAKGKGEMTTFWLNIRGLHSKTSNTGESTEESGNQEAVPDLADDTKKKDTAAFPYRTSQEVNGLKLSQLDDKFCRLVEWNTQVLARNLQEIQARRQSQQKSGVDKPSPTTDDDIRQLEKASVMSDKTVLEEAADVISLPKFCAKTALGQVSPVTITLSDAVTEQLQVFVRTMAAMYRDGNPFHNFEHASHVTMSVVKLLSRIVAPWDSVEPESPSGHGDAPAQARTLHDHTYGITSNPLTRFALIMSALIHDVDHPGVPNSQLVHEQAPLAAAYHKKSIAEQNSVDLAWKLLMGDQLGDLRRAIYCNVVEFKRFRQLLVNSVLATDIMDADLNQQRKDRWKLAFDSSLTTTPLVAATPSPELDITAVHRKATIVMEHLIQASDVAHTMQHWQVYVKWNRRLFEEMVLAYQAGRADRHPAEFWYRGELGFLDHYVIPLATKLQACGVFGVCSDEYLNFALQNRQEWELKGERMVAEYTEMVGFVGEA